MESKTIVAVEIASSKIKGGVCSVDSTGKITVLAVEEIPATNNVRHGRVQNVQEVSADINEIIRKLENNPAVAPRKVESLVLPLGGRSMCGINASATLHFPTDIAIVAETVERLKQEAIKDFVAPKNIEAILPRVFYVNNAEVVNPVGNYGQMFRGEFILIACSSENRRNLDRVKIENVSPRSITYLLRPTAVASLVLTDTERQLGCVLVDFGAETTTVSIYKAGVLTFLATLPLGSRLITRDLMAGLSLTEERAEEFKTSLGNAQPDSNRAALEPNSIEVNNYVQARAGEIAANIVNQIVISGYKNADLPGGIILTGGGATLKNFDNVLAAQSKITVRKAVMPPIIDFRSNFDRTPENIDIVALLAEAAADPNSRECLSEPVVPRQPEVRETVVDTEADDERDTYREPQRAAYTDSYRRQQPRRQAPDENDDDLLDDDPDMPAEKPAARYQEPERRSESRRGDDIFDDDPTEEDSYPGEGGIVEAKSRIEKIKMGIARFFGMPQEEDDANYRHPSDIDDDE